MLRRGREDERDFRRICRHLRNRLLASGHGDPHRLAAAPLVCGYVCGLVYAIAEQSSQTPDYQKRLIQRGYVDIFGDACGAVDFLTLAPELQRQPTFLEGYRLASSDVLLPTLDASLDRRLDEWLGPGSGRHLQPPDR